MAHATMEMNGKTFVLVPQAEYKELIGSTKIPASPKPHAAGNVEALPFARASMARQIILRRETGGLNQKALAIAAGIRVETLNRIEKAKVTADTATIEKIEKALKKAESRMQSVTFRDQYHRSELRANKFKRKAGGV